MNKLPAKLVFATRNQHKVTEVIRILKSANVSLGEILSLDDIGCAEDIPETSPTIAENARQKAMYVYDHYGKDCFAEDTGLCIDALQGEPGVYSARYAGNHKNADDNIDLVLKKLKDHQNRSAHFLTVIALIIDGHLHLFKGKINGTITMQRKGGGGFGYDAIFQPTGHDLTFGEMESKAKNQISHRFLALQKLIHFFVKKQKDTALQ